MGTAPIAVISLLYFGLLFAVAFYADQKRKAGKSIISNPHIYSLSIAVYCTSWTFYGSVGRAATKGIDFLPIYLGPTLMAFTWWFLLRKMVRISKENNIVSIADFISSRYGKSAYLGGIVTIFAVLGIIPYIALQLKAVAYTFDILTGKTEAIGQSFQHIIPFFPFTIDTTFIVALLLALFGVLFGARHLDASERHEGLVAAIALESLVKVLAFVAAGLFVTYGLFNGFSDIFSRFIQELPTESHLLYLNTEEIPYAKWFTMTFASMMAIMFLPRQFHIMVIENSDENHIKKAMWRFPTYLFLINLFVIPIALGGLIVSGGDASSADYFVINLPLQAGYQELAMFVFIGGFSASAGMVMVESVASSTMILNHLIMPFILKLKIKASDISGILINLKRLGIVVVIFFAYLYYQIIGKEVSLVETGLISFIAATQFAPALIGGMYWKGATHKGAMTGLTLGFILWFYTLLVPLLESSFVKLGWVDTDIVNNGLFGFSLLRPEALFGLTGFDHLTHALFWTLFFNLGAFFIISILTKPLDNEKEQADRFVDVFGAPSKVTQRKRLSKAPTIVEFVDLMVKFIGEKQAHAAIAEYIGDREVDEKGSLSEYEIPGLKHFTEKTLAGSVGAAPARIIIENYLATRGSEMEDVFDIFGTVTLSRTENREQLSILYEAARLVASGSDLKTILDNILELLQQQFRFDLCMVRVFNEEKGTLTLVSQKGESSDYLGLLDRELSMETFCGTAFLNNSVTVVNDSDSITKPVSAQIIHQEGVKSFSCTPVAVEGEVIGVLSAFSRTSKGIFTDEFIELFKGLAGLVGVAMRNASQTKKIIEAREQERELQIAETIQLGLLPATTPEIKGLSLAGTCIPARQVGGDYYDFIPRDDNSLDLLIADVSGHNVGAALIMAETRTFIQAKAKDIKNISEIMSALNHFFYKDLTQAELFITMFYLKYNAATRKISYANAGHNPPFIWRAKTQSCERLDTEGLILGVQTQVEFEEKQTHLNPGDILLLYTDGVTEAENPEGTFFGDDRLYNILKESNDMRPKEIIDNVLNQIKLFTGQQSFNDDVSLVVMRVED